MFFNIIVFALLNIACFLGCARRSDQSKQPTFNLSFSEKKAGSEAELENVQHEIVVFVHGTIVGLAGKQLREFRFKTPYIYQPVGDIGLHKVQFGLEENIGSVLAAHNYRRLHEAIYGADRQFHFYTFGWDGCLNANKRREAGKMFYDQLVEVRDALQKTTGLRVQITIQAHSHGGNATAYLKEFEELEQKKLLIDRVGLWGTPIQQETASYWQHSMFNRVYHCYSKKDRVQTLDILSTKRRRSYRTFDKLGGMPDKISQVEICINGVHPTHAELWFLGCINRFLYRKDFPLYPFPCVHLAPAIFHAVDTTSHSNKHLCVNIENNKKSYLFRVSPQHAIETSPQTTVSVEPSFCYDIPHTEPLQAFAHRLAEFT